MGVRIKEEIMENKEKTIDAQWEQKIIERLVEDSDLADLLDLAQDAATHLAVKLSEVRHGIKDGDYIAGSLLTKIGRMLVLLDALQLEFGDAVEEEIEFLQQIEEAME